MKKYIWMFLLVLTLGVVACTSDDLANQGNENNEENTDRPVPTEDQMEVKVTADLTAYVHAAFDEGSTGAALVKRLPLVTNEFTPDTRFALFKGSDFDDGSTVTQDEIISMARVYLKGGYIGLERPTVLQASKFLMALMVGVTTLTQNDYKRNFGLDGTAAAAARQSQAVERISARMENIKQMSLARDGATTRAAGDEKDLNRVMGEMIIFNPIGYFMQDPFETNFEVITHSKDSDGNESEPQTMTGAITRTPYISGQMADAAAEWLNDMLKPQDNPSAALRRTDGNSAINDILSASETITAHSGIDYRDENNKAHTIKKRMKMIINSWGVHNMAENKDYYYLKQDVRLMMGEKNGEKFLKDFSGMDDWKEATGYDHYLTKWYGSFLSWYRTSMELTGDGGTIKLEASAPGTENQGSVTHVAVGSSSGTISILGTTVNGSIMATPGGVGGSLSAMRISSSGITTGTSFMMTTGSIASTLTREVNTNNNKVTWEYFGSLPQYYSDGKHHYHSEAEDILVNDCDVSQQICWSVANPTGQYAVNVTSTPQTAALLLNVKSEIDHVGYYHCHEYTTTGRFDFTHTLLQPNRTMQNWRMYINVDEWENEPVNGAVGELEAIIQKKFPDYYAPQFQVGDKSAESLDMINALVTYSKYIFDENYDILKNYGKDFGIKKYSIYWRCDDRNIETQEPYVVDQDVTLGSVAQVVWCKDNTTLYFINAPELKEGDTWDGQTVSNVWKDQDVTNIEGAPGWSEKIDGYVIGAHATRVVFDKSFADVRPKSCYEWLYNFECLTTIEGIENLNTSEVTTMSWMFNNCSALTTINVDGFDMGKVTDVSFMFYKCGKLTTIYCSQTWNIPTSDYLFGACYNLVGAVKYDRYDVDYKKANPETGYFTWADLAASITLNEKSSNIPMLKHYEGQGVNVQYSRTLRAKTVDGNYVATPYTVCLPYDLDLSAAVSDGQVEIYTLAAVSNGEFVFAKLGITTLEAGVPYLLRIMKGSIGLSANQVIIKTAIPKSTKVYSSLAKWRREDESAGVGAWVGTFDLVTSDDAADDYAYALLDSDGNWNCYTYGGTGTIPGFRAYLSSSDIEQKTYTSRFTE